MGSRERQRKLEILGELKTCTREAARKAGKLEEKSDTDVNATFDALNLLVCAIDERIDDVENAD